ncbi:MAG: OB-fold nucleic acid binding domain-containing protein [Candidatus Syntrophopropionicum ammoniitolerans]
MPDNGEVVLGGLIMAMKKTSTRKGDPMAILTVEDLTGSIEVVVYPHLYARCRPVLRIDEVIMIRGKVRENGDETKIIGAEISTLDSHLAGELHLKMDNVDAAMLDQLQLIMNSFKGNAPVFLHFENEKRVIRTGEEFYVDLSAPMVERLEELFGRERVRVKRDNNMILRPGPAEEKNYQAAGTKTGDKKAKKDGFFSILDL